MRMSSWGVDSSLGRCGARFLLIALLSLHAAAGTWWMRSCGFLARPPMPEAAEFRDDAHRLLGVLHRDGAVSVVKEGLASAGRRSLLVPLTATCVAAIRGDDDVGPTTLWTVNVLFGFCFGVGIYRLVRRQFARGAALLATALALTAPVVFVYQRPFYCQYPMAAVLPWVAEALVRSDGFRRRRWSVWAGFALGVATLAKEIAPVYVLGGAAYAFCRGVRSDPRRTMLNALLFVAAATLLLAPWLASSWAEVLAHVRSASLHPQPVADIVPEDRFTFARWSYYPLHFVNNGIGPLFAILIAAAILMTAAMRRRGGAAAEPRVGSSSQADAARTALALDALVAFALITYVQTAGFSQYMLSAVPAAACAAASLVARARTAAARRGWIAACAITIGLNLFTVLRPFDRDDAVARLGPFELCGRADHFIAFGARLLSALPRPEGETWPIAESAAAMFKDAGDCEPVFLESHAYVNVDNLRIQARKSGRTFRATADIASLRAGMYMVVDDAVARAQFNMSSAEALALAGLRGIPLAGGAQVTSVSNPALVRLDPLVVSGSRPESR